MREQSGLEIQGAVFLEEGQIAEDVLFYFGGIGFGVDLLQFGDDLLDGSLAVAALDDFEAWAIEAQGALGHEKDALALVFAKADAGGEARFAGEFDAHR